MNLSSLITTFATASLIGGCATNINKSASDMPVGKFVKYTCEDSKSFQARFSPESSTVRVRTHEGSAELSQGSRGLYRDASINGDWVLTLRDGNNTELVNNGKAKYKRCSAGDSPA